MTAKYDGGVRTAPILKQSLGRDLGTTMLKGTGGERGVTGKEKKGGGRTVIPLLHLKSRDGGRNRAKGSKRKQGERNRFQK